MKPGVAALVATLGWVACAADVVAAGAHVPSDPQQSWGHVDRDLPREFHRLLGDESAAVTAWRAGEAGDADGHCIAHQRKHTLR